MSRSPENLRQIIEDVRRNGRQRDVRCPAHDDQRASLSVGLGRDGGIVLHCHAGCAFEKIAAATDIAIEDFFPAKTNTTTTTKKTIAAKYDYIDLDGKLLFQVVRYEPKDFRQRRPDGNGGWIYNLKGITPTLFRLPDLRRRITDPSYRRAHNLPDDVFVVEGEKDAERLWAQGLLATTNPMGAGKWREHYAQQLVEIGATSVVVLPDHDEPGRKHAADVVRSCAAAGLKARILELPDVPAKGDVSDYLKTHTFEDFIALVNQPQPPVAAALVDGAGAGANRLGIAPAAAFSDAWFAEIVAENVLRDRFVWCKGLGWQHWTGKRWSDATEESVGEATRQYAVRRFGDAANSHCQAEMDGWRSALSAHRLAATLKLSRGIVERTADEFDAHPDLLNTPDGVVDLRTGVVQPHDPHLLLTKITRGNYRQGYTHPDWQQALTALRDDAQDWMQIRFGQGITGHPTPDGVIPILQGGGENGKSCLSTDSLLLAFGDYASPASPKLIADRGEHSTERADLRGQRLVVAEELTEDRALNVTALKQITDVSMMKARYVRKDNMTFAASHSLFVTTNYVPVVNETDHGTWRRLALVIFPYTYRKPGEPLKGARDRHGDPRLKERLKAGTTGQHDAVVTWAVEGSKRWYANAFPPLPPSVDADTREWRRQADRILGFFDEHLVPDRTACIITTDLLLLFNEWMKAYGHKEWSQETLGSRFRGHHETTRHGITEGRPRKLKELTVSRPPHMVAEIPNRPRVYIGVRFRDHREPVESTDDRDEWSNRSNPPANTTKKPTYGGLVNRLDQLDQGPSSDTASEQEEAHVFRL